MKNYSAFLLLLNNLTKDKKNYAKLSCLEKHNSYDQTNKRAKSKSDNNNYNDDNKIVKISK